MKITPGNSNTELQLDRTCHCFHQTQRLRQTLKFADGESSVEFLENIPVCKDVSCTKYKYSRTITHGNS